MEHIEERDGPKFGVGGYTVLRCDATLRQPNDVTSTQEYCEWKIWGEQFHMDRLSSSFQSIQENLFGASLDSYQQRFGSFHGGGITSMSSVGSTVHTQSMFADSIEETKLIMNTLLEEATRSIRANSINSQHEGSLTHTLMLTILWTATTTSSSGAVKPYVRGHAAFANNNIGADSLPILPTPITACVATPSQPTLEALSVLPRRHGANLNQQRQVGSNASAKLSSWCRIRRPLEDPNRYKPSGVGEVILLRKPDSERGTNIMTYSNDNFIDSLELLEGLISNLFVVYRDGTVRTAPVGLVLPGYARHLIIQELNEQGLKVDSSRPPTMQDMKDGLWSEVFVTSAIRLLVPVERIIMPENGGNNDHLVLWEAGNEEYSATKMIQTAMYQRGCNQATVKNVMVYD